MILRPAWRPTAPLMALLLALGGCAGGGALQLVDSDYVFPPKEILKGAVAARVTGTAAQSLADNVAELLPLLLEQNEAGWSCIDISSLIDAGALSFPLSLGPLVADVGARDLEFCIDLSKLKIVFIEGTSPARIQLSVENARLALAKPAVVFGKVDFVLDNATAACRLNNQLSSGGVPYLTEISFVAEATLHVDEDSAFYLTAEATSLTVHDIGVEVTEDCTLPECSDENPPADACIECSICQTADFGSELAEFLNDAIGELLDPIVAEVINALSQPLLDELLNGQPIAVSARLTLSNVLGAATTSARTASDLGVSLRPGPGGFSVTGTGAASGLEVRLEGGTVADPVHACVGEEVGEPTFAFSEFPSLGATLPDGTPYDIALGLSRPFLNQALWSLYTSGALCLAPTTREIADLSGGAVVVNTGLLDLVVPGLARFAGRTGSVRLRIRPEIQASELPLVTFGAADASGLISLTLPRLHIGLDAFVEGAYTQIIALTATQIVLQLDAVVTTTGTIELAIASLALGPVTVGSAGIFDGVDLGAIIELAVEVLVTIVDGAEPLTFGLDPSSLGDLLGPLPLSVSPLSIVTLGPQGDWLGVFFDVTVTGAAKPGGVAAPPTGYRNDGLLLRRAHHAPPWWAAVQRSVPTGVDAHAASRRVSADDGAATSGCSQGAPGSRPEALHLIGLALALLVIVRRRWLLVLLMFVSGACSDEPDLRVRCAAHADCPPSYTCALQTGLCVPEVPCSGDQDCCPGLTCFGGVCRQLEECSQAGGCLADDLVCVGGRCLAAECAADSACTDPDRRCVLGLCVPVPLCGGCSAGRICEPRTGRCLRASTACAALTCVPGAVGVVLNHNQLDQPDCTPADLECGCVSLPPLDPLEPGGWLSLVRTGAGQLLVVARDRRYADLVSGEVTESGELVGTRVLDGLGDGPVVGDPAGPRGGVVAPGPDVGRNAAAVPLAGGVGAVARDETHGSLRFAFSAPASGLAYDLDAEAGAGVAADLTRHPDGSLHAAYLVGAPEAGVSLRYAFTAPGGAVPQTADSWTTTIVDVGPRVHTLGSPCGGACSPLEACVAVGTEPPTCGLPDLIVACDPACDRNALCVAGVCSELLRPAASVVPWRDGPGSDVAIATRAAETLIALHDHPTGRLVLFVGAPSIGYADQLLAGGGGADVGHALALATSLDGTIALASQDAVEERLVLHYGADPASLIPYSLGHGGVGLAVAIRSDGAVVIVHGQTDGRALRLVWGVPGAFEQGEIITGIGLARSNAVLFEPGGATVASSLDGLGHLGRPRTVPWVGFVQLDP